MRPQAIRECTWIAWEPYQSLNSHLRAGRRKTNTISYIAPTYGIQKDGTGKQWGRRQRTHLGTQRGKERVGQIESAAWKHTLPDAKLPDGNSLYDTGSTNPELCDNPQGGVVGGGFKRKGTYVRLPLIHADVWQKETRHCKAVILKLKVNTFKLKKERDLATQGNEAGMFHRLHSKFRVKRLFPVGQSRLTGRKTCLHSQFIWL